MRIHTIAHSLFMIILCINWAQQESEQGKEKPKVNFKGSLTTVASNTSLNVENITINGAYEKIPERCRRILAPMFAGCLRQGLSCGLRLGVLSCFGRQRLSVASRVSSTPTIPAFFVPC